MEPEVQTTESKQIHPIFKVTTLSKYLAMVLFILLPFVGGYVGYVYAPEKVVEVNRVTSPEKDIVPDTSVFEDITKLDETKKWVISHGTSTLNLGNDKIIENVQGLKFELIQNLDEAQVGLQSHQFTDALRELWKEKYKIVLNADGLPTRDLDVYQLPERYAQVSMQINFTDWLPEDAVEAGSREEAFGKPVSVSYEIFVVENAEVASN